ncbi:MAG: response regulator [Deltaproteobacteria bacterium]|nr:response regulator [Deltaproteobacteria bacterium]MBW2165115.1 response regulator [Deltaproteobacteria bacterium]
MEHDTGSKLEKDIIYLGLLDKAREIYAELGERAVLSYIKSSYRLLSKVYHPDLNPASNRKAEITQQTLNRVNSVISRMTDKKLLDIIKRGVPEEYPAKKRILVVEDEPELQKFFQQILIMEGYNSRIAEDGIKGYEAYYSFKPDLMLCDVVMPWISGLELVGKIRKMDSKIKVIYMSGFFDITPLKGKFNDEVIRYGYHTLAKPFTVSKMLILIKNYLNEDRGEFSGVDTLA